jgi:alcohol dehydrogenase class IV
VVNEAAIMAAQGDTTRIREVDLWLADGLGVHKGRGIEGLRAFIDAHGLPSLADLNVPASDISDVADKAASASSTKANPVRLSHDRICELLRAA